jgi:hypothetical protein
MKCTWLIIILFGITGTLCAQIDEIDGTATMEWLTSMSEEEVKLKVKEKAILNGLEKKYGQVILQGNTTYVKNLSSGNLTESQSVFYSSSNSLVKGEFLRQLGQEKYNVFQDKRRNGSIKEIVKVIRCDISFEAKEVEEVKVLFSCFSTICAEKPLNCKTSTFYDNDNFYLYLKSPTPGYFMVFADFEFEGNHYSSQYLPVDQNGAGFSGGIQIKAGEEYVFFSKLVEKKISNFHSKEVLMVAEMPIETNRFFLILSEKPITTPLLSEIPITKQSEYGRKELVFPKGIRSEKFQSWLYQQRAYNKAFSHQVLDITIKKFKE